MRKTQTLLPLVLLAIPCAAMAQTDGAAAPASDQPAPDKKICKKSKTTGSLTRVKRRCMTEAQWTEEADRARRSVENIQRNGYRRVGEVIDPGGPKL